MELHSLQAGQGSLGHVRGACEASPGRLCRGWKGLCRGGTLRPESRSGEHEVCLGDMLEKEAQPGPTHTPPHGSTHAPGTLTRDGRAFPELLPEGWKGAS